jgi:integrase/recombinase XerD
MSTEIVLSPAPELQPAALFPPTPKAARRVLEFFTTQINNDHTRRAYLNATRRFAQWCEAHGIGELAGVEPFHVAAFIKDLQNKDLQKNPFSSPTVKQHLAALRMLFVWLVIGNAMWQQIAHHESPRTTKLYDRRSDEISLDEVEKISI